MRFGILILTALIFTASPLLTKSFAQDGYGDQVQRWQEYSRDQAYGNKKSRKTNTGSFQLPKPKEEPKPQQAPALGTTNQVPVRNFNERLGAPNQVCMSKEDLTKIQNEAEHVVQLNNELQKHLEKVTEFTRIMENPRLQTMMNILKDKRVNHSANLMIERFDIKKLLIYEGLAILISLLFRAWYTGRQEGFMGHLKAGVVSTAMLSFLVLGVAPFLLFREPYFQFLNNLLKVI